MPTGMITMHEDPNLSQQSKIASERGARILACLLDNPLAKENCQAILAVAAGYADMKSSEASADKVEVRCFLQQEVCLVCSYNLCHLSTHLFKLATESIGQTSLKNGATWRRRRKIYLRLFLTF